MAMPASPSDRWKQPPPRWQASPPPGRGGGKKKGFGALNHSHTSPNLGGHEAAANRQLVRLEPLPLGSQAHSRPSSGGVRSPSSGGASPQGRAALQGSPARSLQKDGKRQKKKHAANAALEDLDVTQGTKSLALTDKTGCSEEESDREDQERNALGEISAAATLVAEAMQAVTDTIEFAGTDRADDCFADVVACREIALVSARVCEGLEGVSDIAPVSSPKHQGGYTDPTLERARKLAELSYEFIEDLEMASGSLGRGIELAKEEGEVNHLQDISLTVQQVVEEMNQLQSESWAVGVLASAAQDKGDDFEKPDEDFIDCLVEVDPDANPDADVIDERDPKLVRMIERTYLKVKGEIEGFDEEEMADLKEAFTRFKVPDSADIHKDDLDALLNYIGRMVPTEEAIAELAKEVTMYDNMDFDEFIQFMIKFEVYEREEQRRIFEKFDEDGSGNISVKELRNLLSGMSLIPFRQMMQEALTCVDKNWDNELSFEELCCFLAVYRGCEGFTKEEVAEFRTLFDGAAQLEPLQSGRNPPPPEYKLCGRDLPGLLIQVFGMQVADNVEDIKQQLASGKGFRVTATATADGGDSSDLPTISFKEFLIISRKTREMEMTQLASEVPGMAGNPNASKEGERGGGGGGGGNAEFKLADTDGNGMISRDELDDFLLGKEFTPHKCVINEIISEVAAEAMETDGEMDFNQFFDFLFLYRQRDGFRRKDIDKFRKGFDYYDEDASGSISTLELSDLFRGFGYRMAVDSLKQLIDRVDVDGTNTLDFREFLRLMRYHRESELDRYKKVFKNFYNAFEGKRGMIYKKHWQEAIEELKAVDREVIQRQCKQRAHIPALDIDDFIDLIDACREEFIAQEKKKAGFTDEELETYKESFENFDKDKSGLIDRMELLQLLKAFNWEPKNKDDRDILVGRLNLARANARDAGVQNVTKDSDKEFGFWEFIQLARILHTLHDRAREQALTKLMDELKFHAKEVNEFHTIFTMWTKKEQNNGKQKRPEDEEADDTGEVADPSASVNRDTVRRVMRSLGMSLTPEKKTLLDTKLDKLEEEGGLRFHGFLRLMKWVIDSDFANMSGK
eukprot:TRINITY_DN12892_c0_g1_i1.p1 TRINITY_DN12892_c0_g1~~TRINITY_DN12892_c0_g1_i1.p1  ORF type:complete len:1178 (+),score=290.17 TRINITY_DN12892_c0_g1_i1:289-3534(+)